MTIKNQLRPPQQVMRLNRMGSFHQSRLSFMRVLLRRIKHENWQFERPIWRINEKGVGIATYSMSTPKRTYTLIAFAHDLPAEKRSDRVIAEAWDATFTLYDGHPNEDDLERLAQNVPLQEAGRISENELCLSRANRSVRLFKYVIDCLSKGKQPNKTEIIQVGYLMRTTAVYGASKFGAADRHIWKDREEFQSSFQPELLTVWLIRTFSIDLVEHIAQQHAPDKAINMSDEIKRLLGIGNSTGLGMAPFLINHPALIHSWIDARETALTTVTNIEKASTKEQQYFTDRLNAVIIGAKYWCVDDTLQTQKIHTMREDFDKLKKHLNTSSTLTKTHPWKKLYQWMEKNTQLEAQEQLVSLMLEPYGNLVDHLSLDMSSNEQAFFRIDGQMPLSKLKTILQTKYSWAIHNDYNQQESKEYVWYVSQEKLEPRLGKRFEEPIEEFEQPLAPGRDVSQLWQELQNVADNFKTADFLLKHPEYRHIIRRIQLANQLPYAEIQDNTIAAEMLPLDLLRCKLSFFGATHFDPRSDRWLRITLFQGCPYPNEIKDNDPDDAFYPYLNQA